MYVLGWERLETYLQEFWTSGVTSRPGPAYPAAQQAGSVAGYCTTTGARVIGGIAQKT